MKIILKLIVIALVAITVSLPFPDTSAAWHDETHLAISKVAGYYKWYNSAGADMAKIKAGHIEGHNHFVNNPKETEVTPGLVFSQIEKYNKTDPFGHLYGAIFASIRDYQKKVKEGKYGEYHLAFCAHYVGDLSQPLHNIVYNAFNRKYHQAIDGIINKEVMENLDKIKIYGITISSEQGLAKEIAKIANDAKKLGYRLEAEGRVITKEEAFQQISHSASLFRGILKYLNVPIVR